MVKQNSCGLAIGYYGKMSFELLTKFNNKSGCILIIEVEAINELLILIKLYSTNTEYKQLGILFNLSNMLQKNNDINNKSTGDFNLFLEARLEATGENPVLKKKYLAKLIQIKEKFDLCDNYRIRNPITKHCTLHRQYSSGYAQGRLNYFSTSNVLHEPVKKRDLLAAFSTNQLPLTFSFSSISEGTRGKGLLMHNNSYMTIDIH